MPDERPFAFRCPNGCIRRSMRDEPVGHYCRRSLRIGGKHAWIVCKEKVEV